MKIIFTLVLILQIFTCSAGVTQWIDFNLDNGHVKIPVKIADIDTYAILDTGSQLNAINKAFITKHDLSFDEGSFIRVKGAFGIEKRPTRRNIPIQYFGLETELDKVTELTLGHHSNGLLLGAGFFSKFVTQFDYPNKKMRMIDKDSINVQKFKNIVAQRQKGTGMPIVKVGFPNDRHIWLLLDTGNTGGMVVDRNVAIKMGWLEQAEIQEGVTSGVNEVINTEHFTIPSLKFGPFEMEDVAVTIPGKGSNSYLESQFEQIGTRIKGRKVEGVIGYDVLKHFLITIDYKGGDVHIGLPEA